MPPLGEHLSQEKLDEKAAAVLVDLETWLAEVEFKPERKNLHRCGDDPALYNIIKRLVDELGFISNTDPLPGYNAFRIPASASGPVDILVSTGPAYLFPLHVSKNAPAITSQPFEPGTATLVRQAVKVNPGFEFLMIAPPQR